MGADLNADERAAHGVGPEVIAAELARVIAEGEELDRDAEEKLAEVAPDLARARRRNRDERARLERATRPRFQIQRLADRGVDLAKPPPAAPVLLTYDRGASFMRSGIVASLVAPGGTGKTFALVQLAVALASGTRWLDRYHPTRKGPVFLGLAEEDDDEVQRRLCDATRGLDPYTRAEVERNLAAHGFTGHDVAFLRRAPDKSIGASEWFETLKAELAARGPWRAIILDPWSRWGGVDAETDAHAATSGVRLLEALTRLEGSPAVIVAHHTRKVAKGSTGPTDASDARGSSAFVDGGRFTMNLSRGNADLLSLRVTKTNGTIPGPELFLARGVGGILRPATEDEIAESNTGHTKTKLPKQAPAPTPIAARAGTSPW